jgi:hypothetical protein
MSAYLYIQGQRKIREKIEFVHQYRIAKGGKGAEKQIERWAREAEITLMPPEN